MSSAAISKLQQSLVGGALILGTASLVSRLLGLVRDRLLSTTFGAGEVLDSYFAAFKVPDFVFNILVLGALSASFVPIFIEYSTQKSREEAMKLANGLLNLLFFALTIMTFLCMLFAPQLVSLIAYGDSPDQQKTIVFFMRVLSFSLIFFGVSNIFSGILHSLKQYMVYALAPIFYNVGIIIGILFFVPAVGVIGLPLGVVLGSFFHLAVQLPFVYKAGFRFFPTLSFSHPGIRKILLLMPPRALALGFTQINILLLFALASTLDEGSRAVWQFADNIQHFPINIFGVSLALAAFPVFSEAFAERDLRRFTATFSENFRRILFFIIPISIATLLLRAQIVRLIYGAGQFDWNDTILTAQTLGAFSISMFAQALIPLLARSFFAKQDTVTPVLISVGGILFQFVLALLLIDSFGIIGLAAAYSFAAIFQMLGLLIVLRLRHGDLDDDRLISSTGKIIISSLAMGIVIQGLKYIVAPLVDMHTFLGIFIQTVVALIGGGMVYLLCAVEFQFDEAKSIWKRIRAMWLMVKNLFIRS